MTYQGKGKADYLELGDWNAQCYQCGRKFKASTMRRNWQGYWVCPPHWEARQPQDFVRGVPDIQSPPWTQPMPAYSYASYCTTVSAIADYAIAGCAMADNISVPPPGVV